MNLLSAVRVTLVCLVLSTAAFGQVLDRADEPEIEGPHWGRFALITAGTTVAVSATLGIGLAVVDRCPAGFGGLSCTFDVFGITVALIVGLAPLLASGIDHLQGGEEARWGGYIGSPIGLLLSTGAWIAGLLLANGGTAGCCSPDKLGTGGVALMFGMTGLIFGLSIATSFEVTAHIRATRRLHVTLAPVPIPGGAGLAFGGKF